MTFDVYRIRAEYPALADGFAYLDGAGGVQVPTPVIDAIAGAYRTGVSNLHGAFPSSRRSGDIVSACRQAVADLVGGRPDGVILGPNMTTLTYRLSSALSAQWSPGDEVVVSRLDHDANIRPWVQAAARAGAVVRWAEVDTATGELPVEQYDALISERTRLVAVTAASNILGTRPDVAGIVAKAHEVGALTYIDGVHAAAHGPVDMGAVGADFYAVSAYKWSGPHIGAVVASPQLLEGLHPDKLTPSSDDVPWRFETGTSPFADLAGVTAAVDHLASLDPDAVGSRRERLLASMSAAESHQHRLYDILVSGLSDLKGVTLFGNAQERTATAYFVLEGHTPLELAEHLASQRVNAWSGHAYAWELTRALGIRDSGSAVRASIAHYTSRADVDRLLNAMMDLTDYVG
jgi:cysteine desulfurase family protein (TIGR01976 family)